MASSGARMLSAAFWHAAAVLLIVLMVIGLFCGCGGVATTRYSRPVPKEEVLVALENATPYILRCKVKQDSKWFTGRQPLKNIPAKSKSSLWLPPDQKFIIEGEAFAGEDIVGYFAKPFATVNYILGDAGNVAVEPVVIDDIISFTLPALSGVIVNMCEDKAVASIRVYNPQNPTEYLTLMRFGEYGFMTIVSGQIIWVQEYYDKQGKMILRTTHQDYLDPGLRGRIFHGGRRLDFRRLIY